MHARLKSLEYYFIKETKYMSISPYSTKKPEPKYMEMKEKQIVHLETLIIASYMQERRPYHTFIRSLNAEAVCRARTRKRF